MDLILATSDGRELGLIPYDADISVGGENTFEIGVPRAAWDDSYQQGMLVYVPDTEYGGIIGEVESLNEPEVVYVRGLTWRGLLEKKIIQPAAGQDYYTISGEANACIGTVLSAFYADGLMQAGAEDTGVNISSYSFNRYTTVIEGLNAMLAPYSYKARIAYRQTDSGGYVEVFAEPIENYAAQVELSEDDEMIISTDQILNGVNHLICLGAGELRDRTVVHLYTDMYGNISPTQVLFGRDEIAEVYDYSSASNAAELRAGGLDRLEEVKSRTKFDAQIVELSTELRIGDIISGRDFVTGLYVELPIVEKILKIIGEIPEVQYVLEG